MAYNRTGIIQIVCAHKIIMYTWQSCFLHYRKSALFGHGGPFKHHRVLGLVFFHVNIPISMISGIFRDYYCGIFGHCSKHYIFKKYFRRVDIVFAKFCDTKFRPVESVDICISAKNRALVSVETQIARKCPRAITWFYQFIFNSSYQISIWQTRMTRCDYWSLFYVNFLECKFVVFN